MYNLCRFAAVRSAARRFGSTVISSVHLLKTVRINESFLSTEGQRHPPLTPRSEHAKCA
jgi:hypothetical protein